MFRLNNFAEGGVENALLDATGRGSWTYAKLTSYINKNAEIARYARLSTIHKSTVYSILDEAEIKPFRIKSYCENC